MRFVAPAFNDCENILHHHYRNAWTKGSDLLRSVDIDAVVIKKK